MAVTVPGTSGAVTIAPGTGDVLNLASQIASLLATIQGGGGLAVTSDTVGGSIPPVVTVPGSLRGSSSDYVVANNGGSIFVSDDLGGRDGAQTIGGDNVLRFSDGFGLLDPTGTAENVFRLYKGLLDRGSSIDELKFWTALVDKSHLPLNSVADSFIAGPEFINRYGTLSDAAFVSQVYHNMFGRAPDDAGLKSWTDRLAGGATRGAVALGIVESSEGQAGTLSAAGDNENGEVYRLYQTAFGRAPEEGAQAFWTSVMASGATAEQVAAAIAGLPEFQLDDATLNVSNYVTRLYQNALHRAPDQAGLNAWVTAITGGLSRADALLAIADSLETRVSTSRETHANWVFESAPNAPVTSQLLLNGTGGQTASVPGGYNYIVVNDSTADTLSASNAVLITNTVGGTFFVSGTSTIAATGGNNTVNATGTYALSFGPGNDLVIASGSGTIATGDGSSTVVAANTSGPGNVIESHGAGDVINTLFGKNAVNASGGNSTITAGQGTLTVSVTGANDLVLTGASTATVTAGGGSSGLTVNGGTGPLEFVGGTSAATVIGGSGGSTIFGASGDIKALLGSGADSVSLGSGNDTITTGAGAETLSAGSGTNHFDFISSHAAGTTQFVTDTAENIANDTFTFTGTPTNAVVGGQLTLTLSDNTKVTFTNLNNISQLPIV